MAKSERFKLTKILDELCKRIIRIRDKDTCQHCLKEAKGSNAHTCHVVPKDNGASWRRFDLRNIFLGCYHCHINWWHKNPLEATAWYIKKYPKEYRYLAKYRGGKPAKISTPEMKELEQKYKEMLK